MSDSPLKCSGMTYITRITQENTTAFVYRINHPAFTPRPQMSAAQSTTVHDGLLHPRLRHCSSTASAVRRLPSAVRTATPAFEVRSSGLFCSQPGSLEIFTCEIRHVPLTVFAGTWKLFFSRFTSVHSALEVRNYALNKSTIDTDTDNHCPEDGTNFPSCWG